MTEHPVGIAHDQQLHQMKSCCIEEPTQRIFLSSHIAAIFADSVNSF